MATLVIVTEAADDDRCDVRSPGCEIYASVAVALYGDLPVVTPTPGDCETELVTAVTGVMSRRTVEAVA